MSRRHGHTPKFSLMRVKEIVATGYDCVRITRTALVGAEDLYFEAADIIACIWGLGEDDYEQTLESTAIPGTFQDVYRPRFHGYRIYLKLRLIEERAVVVISFKRDTSP